MASSSLPIWVCLSAVMLMSTTAMAQQCTGGGALSSTSVLVGAGTPTYSLYAKTVRLGGV